MSFISKNESVQDGNGVRFFLFTQGSTVYRYTTLPKQVTFQSEVWNPLVLTTGELDQTNDVTKDTYSVSLPISDPLAVTFLGYPLDVETSLLVYLANFDELGSYVRLWSGNVTNTVVNDNVMTLECSPIARLLKSRGLRPVFSRNCRHQVYQQGCNLNPTNYRVTGKQVVEIIGLSLAIPSVLDTTGNGPYTGGFLEAPDGTLRTIVKHSSMYFTLDAPIMSIVQDHAANPGSVVVSLYKGCDRTPAACQALNNYGNFGGYDIPTSNPFKVSLQ